ncbi:MAG: ABC transporter permease [Clostridiales Family XIII bacterium]|jgi:ribose transport system permease protein|nr:ABC transporter permease [Clostridiales Family XIII bacterium]
MKNKRIRTFISANATLIAVVAILIIASITVNDFFSINNFVNLFKQTSMVGIIAIGGTFVIITAGIDLSVGALFGFASVMVGIISMYFENDFLMIIMPIIVCAGFGAFTGFCVTKLRIEPFIVTLAMMSAIRGIGLLITNGGESLMVSSDSFKIIATGSIGIIPIPAIIMIAAFIVATIVSKYTIFGRNCYAIGGNNDAAIAAGIPVNTVKFFTYVISGACTGLAGVIVAARTFSGNILLGDGYEMDVIAAIVLGGTLLQGGRGNMLNSMWGALIITIIGNIINLKQVSYLWEGCITGGLLLAILVVQSRMNKKQYVLAQS